ncbi:ATP-grasp domain-containing protein [Candidatus Cardinium hertigii]|uniref:ATP-grasp domain-containing protein n=1 Tax=Candidatus Cardinium hertigii TaxID=247481 RepID=UPI003D7DD674
MQRSHIVKAIKSCTNVMGNVSIIANDDTIFQIVATVREQLAIPGPTLNELLPFCCKQTSKERLEGSNVAYPKFLIFDYQFYIKNPSHYVDRVGNKLGFPIIVKPTNLAGSLEIQKINNLEELSTWCSRYEPQEILKSYGRAIPFIFETCIPTEKFDLFHCDSVINNGQVIFTQVSRYAYPCMEVGTNGKNCGSIFIPDTIKKYKALYELPELVITAFKRFAAIPNGVMHLEAFRDRYNGQIIFLETQLRAPGGEVCTAYKYALDIDLVEVDYRLQMNLPISLNKRTNFYTAWLQIPTQTGIIDRLILPKVKSSILKMNYKIVAHQKTERPSSILMHRNTALNIIIGNKNYAELVKDFNYLKDFEPFVYSVHTFNVT